MLCCLNFDFPESFKSLLYRLGLNLFVMRFKNANYLIIRSNILNSNQMYFVQLVDEQNFGVEPRTLRSNIFILVVSRVYLASNPEKAAGQIADIVNDSFSEYPIYPPSPTPLVPLFDTPPIPGIGKGIYPWPSRVFSPYVDTTAWPPFMFADMAESTGVLFYNLGFIVAKSNTNCTPSWGTFYDIAGLPSLSQIGALREMGGDVTVSFGGAANTPLHVCAESAETLANLYLQIIMMLQLTRIDFDIEGAWVPNTAANQLNSEALAMVQSTLAEMNYDLDIWFTLPILTNGFPGAELELLSTALNAGVTIAGVNAMTMDYGPPIEDMAGAGIDAINSANAQLIDLFASVGETLTPSEVYALQGTTPMIGVNDVQGEIFTVPNATTTLNFAESVGLGQISMWSSNRDNEAISGVTQQPNQFSIIFQPYTDFN